jgi:hypothetical protein
VLEILREEARTANAAGWRAVNQASRFGDNAHYSRQHAKAPASRSLCAGMG